MHSIPPRIHALSLSSGTSAGTVRVKDLLAIARAALLRFRHEDAIGQCETVLARSQVSVTDEASARCLLAEALENLARFPEAIHTLAVYGQPEVSRELAIKQRAQVCLRLGSVWLTTDSARALAHAKQALKFASQDGAASLIGDGHLLLGRIYRRIGEVNLALDHFLQAQVAHRRAENHPGLIRASIGIGSIRGAEGEVAAAQEAFAQARALLDHPGHDDEPSLRGSLAVGLATVAGFRGSLSEGVALLEGAITYFERARLPRLIALAQSNLGFILLRLGKARQARGVLEQALASARAYGGRAIEANTLETLAELLLIQGEFAEAGSLLAPSIATLQALPVGFNEAQAQLTLGRCYLLGAESPQAAASAADAFRASLEVSQRIGDRRGQIAARLWLVEACLARPQVAEARRLLEEIRSEIDAPLGQAHLPLIGHFREVAGRIALSEGHQAEAIHCLDQAVSIYELTGHHYHLGVASFHLGRAYTLAGISAQARAACQQAEAIFKEMEAQPMLAQMASWQREKRESRKPARIRVPSSAEAVVSGVTRLMEAGHSRELLLHELARMLHRHFAAAPVIVYERADGGLTPLVYYGCDKQQALSLGQPVEKPEQKAQPSCRLHHWGENGSLALYVGGAEVSPSLLQLFIKQAHQALANSRPQPPTKNLALVRSSAHVSHSPLPQLIFQSAAMRQVAEQVAQLRDSRLTVLITGESGTGKELIARSIHDLSSRAGRPFVTFNCAATPRDLLESLLFGHRKGAFTGAHQDQPGVIRSAAEGTLLLDEIGDLAIEMQSKLLRFLQEGEIQPLGAKQPMHVDVRVIAATNRDLERLVAEGKFREDLWYRLSVIELHLPPLRERREEIPLLIAHFLERCAAETNQAGITIAREAVDLMMRYDWPGNVRQLENELKRLVAFTHAGEEITAEMLSSRIKQDKRHLHVVSSSPPSPPKSLAEAVAEVERRVIAEALERNHGNLTHAAKELKLTIKGLKNKLQRLGIKKA